MAKSTRPARVALATTPKSNSRARAARAAALRAAALLAAGGAGGPDDVLRRAAETLNTLLEVVERAESAKSTVGSAVAKLRERSELTLHIGQDDYLYFDALTWLQSLPSASEPRSWIALQYRDRIHYVYNDTGRLEAQLGPHRVKFKIESRDDAPATRGDSVMRGPARRVSGADSRSLRITVYTLEALEAVKAELARLVVEQRQLETPPCVHVYSRWDSWEKSSAPLRPLSSVVTDGGVGETLRRDMAAFFASEKLYGDRGVPWHRNYVLWGPPGTGKTSLVQGFAHEFGANVYFLSLSDVEGDEKLYERVSEIRARSLVLLEDVDTCGAASARVDGRVTAEAVAAQAAAGGQQRARVTLGGLLNVLDGMFTPHGAVIVMTTNFPELLDAALTRSRRASVWALLGYCASEQADEMFAAFYDHDPVRPFDFGELPVVPSQVTDVLVEHFHDRAGAERELHALADRVRASGALRDPRYVLPPGESAVQSARPVAADPAAAAAAAAARSGSLAAASSNGAGSGGA